MVAAGKCKSVGSATGIDGNDVDIEIQVFDKAFDNCQLLVVFFAEAGGIGLDDVEQFADDSSDTAEMTGAEFAAQFVLEVGRLDVETLFDIGIQLFFVRREHDGYAFVGEFVGVLLQGARVFVEILALSELQAVDEYADDDVVGAFFGFANEGEMAFVQIAHSRHKGNAACIFAPFA